MLGCERLEEQVAPALGQHLMVLSGSEVDSGTLGVESTWTSVTTSVGASVGSAVGDGRLRAHRLNVVHIDA